MHVSVIASVGEGFGLDRRVGQIWKKVEVDTAWGSIEDSTNEVDRDSVRDVVGKAIVGLARYGYT